MFEWTVARSHILGNPRMVLFTLLSVALAVAVIVVLIGLTNGYRENLISDTVENNPHITVDPKEDEDYISLYRTLSNIIQQCPEVEVVSPRLVGKASARYEENSENVIFIGADPLQEDRMLKVQEDMILGDYHDLRFKKYAAVVGEVLAADLELKRGEDFRLVGQNRSINVKPVGIIATGTRLDEFLVYLPLETAQDLEGKGDVVSEVGVRVSDIYAAPAVADDLNKRTEYDAQSWQELNREVLEQLDTEQIYSYIFYILILIISGFGIANTMIMIISRRTKEIGIMMAMGATQRSIMNIFILESVVLGPPATLLGGLLAYLAAELIGTVEVPTGRYVSTHMAVVLDLETFIYVSIFALLINFVAGIYPAYKASKLDPVEAIATE